jgi:hypothetical protein
LTERTNTEAFNQYVGWANILGMSFGAIGTVLLAVDRVLATKRVSASSISDTADQLANEVLRTESRLLAQLLGTDDLDSRAAPVILSTVSNGPSDASGSGSISVTLENLHEFYVDRSNGRLLIEGGPGAGKTVVALRILNELASRRKSTNFLLLAGGGYAVPVIFNLAAWGAGLGLKNWLGAELSLRFSLCPEAAHRLVDEGYVLPILDGFDEVGDERESARISAMIADINRFQATAPYARMIITCRDEGLAYRRLERKLKGFTRLTIHGVGVEDVVYYLRSQCDDKSELKEIEKRISARSPLYMLLNVPWRLAMAATFQKSGEDMSALLPTQEEARRSRGRRLDAMPFR